MAPQGIPFPEETHCKLINRVDIDSDNALTRNTGENRTAGAGTLSGSEGIRLLAYTLQNELIAQGYITSLIDVPSQSLEHGILRFTLHYGKVGAIDYADGSDTTRLWNSTHLFRYYPAQATLSKGWPTCSVCPAPPRT